MFECILLAATLLFLMPSALLRRVSPELAFVRSRRAAALPSSRLEL